MSNAAERAKLVAKLDEARDRKAKAVADIRAAKNAIQVFDDAHPEVVIAHCKAIAEGNGTAKRLAN